MVGGIKEQGGERDEALVEQVHVGGGIRTRWRGTIGGPVVWSLLGVLSLNVALPVTSEADRKNSQPPAFLECPGGGCSMTCDGTGNCICESGCESTDPPDAG